ncbi:MAG: ComEC/Rec2 family competence protein [Bdellovibrionaceae bacterium]|nr:ComEC/Rec2 family competence protein [Pseudobdellovibrionaceae bacterium]
MPKKSSTPFCLAMLIFLALIFLNLGQKIRDWTSPAQKICINYFKSPAQINQVAQALFCGAAFKESHAPNLQSQLTQMGVVHILVASGSNVYLALKYVKRCSPLKFKTGTQSLVLLFMLLMSGFEAPIVRATLQILLLPCSQKYSLGWTHFRRVSAANLIYLFIFPSDLFSLSFQLSVLASYSLAYISGLSWWTHVVIFGVMSPLLLQMQAQQTQFILNNMFLAPILSPLLMGLALVALVLQPIALAFDFVLTYLQSSLHWILLVSHPNTLPQLDFLMYQPSRWHILSYFVSAVLCFEACEFLRMYHRKKYIYGL